MYFFTFSSFSFFSELSKIRALSCKFSGNHPFIKINACNDYCCIPTIYCCANTDLTIPMPVFGSLRDSRMTSTRRSFRGSLLGSFMLSSLFINGKAMFFLRWLCRFYSWCFRYSPSRRNAASDSLKSKTALDATPITRRFASSEGMFCGADISFDSATDSSPAAGGP